MCYIVEYNEQIFSSVLQMTVTIEKKDLTIESVNVWITSDHDFLDAVHITSVFHLGESKQQI